MKRFCMQSKLVVTRKGASPMKKCLVTGATGYIGSRIIRELQNDMQITALVRNVDKATKMLPQGVNYNQVDLEDAQTLKNVTDEYTYVIHCAAITKSKDMKVHPVEVVKSIVNTTQNIMEVALRCKAQSVVVLSSMEIYGYVENEKEQRTSEDAVKGEIDLLNVRSCYPLAKRMAENICFDYWQEYGVPVKIARLAQTFGTGILPEENRVFAQFARSVIKNQDIVLHTDGTSMGNYCGIDDAIKGILLLLEKGENGEAYNIVNEQNTMTIRQMAELVADKIAGGKISVCYDIPKENIYGYAANTGLQLSAQKMCKLGWSPQESLEKMFLDAIDTMKDFES